jgi:hypothetical protein
MARSVISSISSGADAIIKMWLRFDFDHTLTDIGYAFTNFAYLSLPFVDLPNLTRGPYQVRV